MSITSICHSILFFLSGFKLVEPTSPACMSFAARSNSTGLDSKFVIITRLELVRHLCRFAHHYNPAIHLYYVFLICIVSSKMSQLVAVSHKSARSVKCTWKLLIRMHRRHRLMDFMKLGQPLPRMLMHCFGTKIIRIIPFSPTL